MKIPRYWIRANIDETGRETEHDRGFCALGWSDVSIDDARRCGIERARRIRARLDRKPTTAAGEYPYPDRPVREQVIERDDDAGWAITRNGYGALVLNAANAMFVDIDLPAPGSSVGKLIGRMLGRKKPDPAQTIIAQVRQVVEGMTGMGARLYCTAGGFRVLVTSETYDPTSELTHELLCAFDSDRRYAMLCKVQECFRARLTPKPWRCDVARPPVTFPFDSDAAAQRQAAWVSQYNLVIRSFSVCQCIETLGSGMIAPAVEPIVKLHDEHACCNCGSPLA